VKVTGGAAAATTPATGLLQHECGYYDVEQVQRVSKALLLTLARVCVERSGSSHAAGELVMRSNHLINNSSGGGGTSPNGSAMRMEGEIKREMLEYLQQQSEAYASGSGALSNSPGMTTVCDKAENTHHSSHLLLCIRSQNSLYILKMQ